MTVAECYNILRTNNYEYDPLANNNGSRIWRKYLTRTLRTTLRIRLLFYNTAVYDGGGMYNNNSLQPTITTFLTIRLFRRRRRKNLLRTQWLRIVSFGRNPKIAQIVYLADIASFFPPTVSYCLTQNYSSGTGIIQQDPLFVDAANGDFSFTKLFSCYQC
jgi:hypothetical protein